MKIDITDLLSIENRIEERLTETDLVSFRSKLGDFPIRKKEPFTLHLENQDNKWLLVSGRTKVTLAMPCARCLEETSATVSLVIDRKIPLKAPEGDEGEAEGAADYLEGCSLDVDKLVFDEILLNRPLKVLCSNDCKGICRTCGANLNHAPCSCCKTEPDPRMAAIRDVFDQFKEV